MLKAMLVGCGGMGTNWARILDARSDIKIIGLVDVEASASARLKERTGIDTASYTNFEQGLEELRPDVVLDTSIPETRRYIAGTAMEQGCHVLSEKPLACSVQEAKELVSIANSTGRTHAVMQNRRYLPGSQQVRELIESGEIGKLGMVCADFFIGAHFEGFRLLMDNVLLLDMAIHTFDQARYMTGLDCDSAFCREFNLPSSWYEGNASAICIFEMQGGVPFCYRGSWTAEGANTTWESSWRFVGDKGTVIWDGANPPYAEIVDSAQGFIRPTRRVLSDSKMDGPSGHPGCLNDMINALDSGEQPMTNSVDNAKSLGMVFAAIESAASGNTEPVLLNGLH